MADARTFFIYCVTSPSGKRYVGQTSRSVRKRWQNHLASAVSGSTLPVHQAIRKYGVDACLVEELARTSSRAVANHLERAYVDSLNALVPYGYNIADGGADGWQSSSRMRERYRQAWAKGTERKALLASLGRANAGRQATPETRAKMSAAHRKIDTPETCEKRRSWWTPERRAARAAQVRERRSRG